MLDAHALARSPTWVFDLDHTLYRPESGLFQQVERRMGRYIEARLGLAPDAAKALQKALFRAHGSTLRGLMREHGEDGHAFLAYVHDIDYAGLAPDSSLAAALERLPGRKLVFTNGSAAHAEGVLARLALDGHFAAVFDIVAVDWLPKPAPAAYDRLLARHGVAPEGAVMVEDVARNLAPAAALGMTTVWLRTAHGWAGEGAEAAFVHHTIGDLTEWLEGLAATV